MSVLDPVGTDVPDAVTAERLAADWLSEFAAALARSDADAAADLFLEDSHWRDVLAFTWDLRTFSGRERVRAALEATAAVAGATNFRVAAEPSPRHTQRAGVQVIEAFFDFDTSYGGGRGVLRLPAAPDQAGCGRARAWTLLTTLQRLTGFEERVGARRPRGDDYAATFGGENWLDRRRVAQEYADSSPEVLVVGGGQGGMSLAARLGQLGVDTLVVDRMQRVGDNWRRRYHSLALHNEVWVCHLPYLPFPPTWPVYVPKDMLADWFEAYARAIELNFWTGTEFVSGTYDERAQRWTVVLKRADGAERILHPGHLVLATGVSGIPKRPDLPGLDGFGGVVMHSSAYTDGSAFRGKRALVVGSGNSGHDVAQDLHGHGADVTLVQRSPTTIVSVEPAAQKIFALYSEGPSTEDCDLLSVSIPYPVLVKAYQMLTRVTSELDEELLAGLAAAGFQTDSGRDGTGFHMKYLRYGGGYYLNVGCSDLIVAGDVDVLPSSEIATFTDGGVLLEDGTSRPVDLVVLATGYRPIQDGVRKLLGDEVADRVGPVWGFDEDGDLRNMWRRTAQEGLWFMAGSLAQCRTYSRFLALQVKACQEDIIARQRVAV